MISLASTELNNRGPDYSSIQISSNKDILLVNSVLSINQGSSYQDFPVLNSDEFFGFNGEIYITSDYDHKYSGSDTLYVLNSARKEFDIEKFYGVNFRGCFSFVHAIRTCNEMKVQFANDFFGERNLFYYEDDQYS